MHERWEKIMIITNEYQHERWRVKKGPMQRVYKRRLEREANLQSIKHPTESIVHLKNE